MIIRLMNFLHDNWVGVILMMTLILFVFYLWAAVRNAEFGAHYDLTTIWPGVLAIATAAGAGWGKWFVDGKYNSANGEPPGTDKQC